jgi:hypothetical protein
MAALAETVPEAPLTIPTKPYPQNVPEPAKENMPRVETLSRRFTWLNFAAVSLGDSPLQLLYHSVRATARRHG